MRGKKLDRVAGILFYYIYVMYPNFLNKYCCNSLCLHKSITTGDRGGHGDQRAELGPGEPSMDTVTEG